MLSPARGINITNPRSKNSSQKVDLLNLFDNEAVNPTEEFEDFNLEEEATTQSFYAVAAGVVPGIYKDYNECQRQVHGYSGATFKKFRSLKKAQAFILTKTTNTTGDEIADDHSLKQHQLNKPLFSSVAAFPPISPGASTSSKGSRRPTTPYKQLTFHGQLTNSQQDPILNDQGLTTANSEDNHVERQDQGCSPSENSTPESTRNFEARCPDSCLDALHTLINSGVSNMIIEAAIQSFQENEDTAKNSSNVHR